MSKMNCAFCKINQNTRDESYRVISSQLDCLIMLSLNPQTTGHSLVIPKNHYSSLSKIPKKLSGELFYEAIRAGELLVNRLSAKAYIIKVNNNLYRLEGKNKGHINHIHIHVIPRYFQEEVLEESPQRISKDELTEVKNKIIC